MNAQNQTRSPQSAVEFPTASRPHIGLPVRDIAASIRFYAALLGAEPVKVRPGYAKFETHEPPLNLALNEAPEGAAPHPTQHFGIQVKSTEAVVAHHGRVRAAGFSTMNEEGVTCCFAVQDKVWAVDPDGHRWEVFVVLEADADVHSAPAQPAGRLPDSDPAGAGAPAQAQARDTSGSDAPGCCA